MWSQQALPRAHSSPQGPALPHYNCLAYTRDPAAAPQSTLQVVWKTVKRKKKGGVAISSRLPALVPQQVACQVEGWVGEQGVAPQEGQLEVGSWLVANPSLEEGEEGLHEQGEGVGAGVGNWGCR